MIKQSFTRIAAALLLAASTVVASAQFEGPRSTDTSTINVPRTITTDPAILFPPSRDIRLSPGDTVVVSVYGTTDYHATDRVSLNGYLNLPLIDPVQVSGLSPHEVEHLLQVRFETENIFRNPQVTVSVTESPNQIATVIGEIHAVVPLLVPKRLFEVIAAAGGLPPTASHVVTIHRPGITEPITLDLGNNPAESKLAQVPIFAGDTIIISRPDPIYIMGAVKTQSVVSTTSAAPLSMLQAISMAGGPLFEAKLHDVYIIRTTAGKRNMIRVDYSRILHGKNPDPILLGDDIVVVPTSAIKAAIHNGGIGILMGVVSTVIYIAVTR